MDIFDVELLANICSKTQVALAYVYWVRNTLPDTAVFWVHASSAERFRQGYIAIAKAYKIPGYDDLEANVLQLVKIWLETKLRTRWLMIIDNADDIRTFFQQSPEDGLRPESKDDVHRYIPECSHGTVLITTRNKKVGVKLAPGKSPISVGPMDDGESYSFLRKILDDEEISTEKTTALACRLKYLPLALAQAVAFVQENEISIDRYLQLLDESDEGLIRRLSEPFETVGRDSETLHAVTATWIISFKQIRDNNPLDSDILSVMSLYHWQAIPRELVQKYCHYREIEVGVPIPSDMLEKSLGTLKAFSFISEDKDGNMNLHRLVYLVTRKWLDIE